MVSDLGLFDDRQDDPFQREPHAAHFRVKGGSFEFIILNIHTRPRAAVREIAALHRAVLWAQEQVGEDSGIIVLGDFNASCSYASPQELDALAIRSSLYQWIVPDNADTNLARSRCAYDRIVLGNGVAGTKYSGVWSVWNAFQSVAISDHWPIWASFAKK